MKIVIMAGGFGTRLWPLSRALYPKQFLCLHKEETMLQATLSRLDGLSYDSVTVLANEEHRFIVAEQLRGRVERLDIILEPVGRNTAPAIALAALNAIKNGKDELLLVLPSDHLIEDEQEFIEKINSVKSYAEDGKLVTFGIQPKTAETGFGYIKRGVEIQCSGIFSVSEFVEKPEQELANTYLNSGEYYWNSGMFLFKASRYIEELNKYRPDIFRVCEDAIDKATNDLDFIRVNSEIFENCPEDSIDYAVMENTDAAIIVPMDAGWNDVGSWSSLWEVSEKDKNGNSTSGDVLAKDSTNCLIHASNKLVATLGVEDLVIVETKDVVLVATKEKVQDIKELVNTLKNDKRAEFELHREVYRPWGKYDSIDVGNRDQVKRITVNPGAKLSVQMHHHRAEHWVVVSGTAKVTNGEETFLLRENESTYIPIGVIHALENPGKVPLELIEVQSGDYLGEDDIVRFEDRYGRN